MFKVGGRGVHRDCDFVLLDKKLEWAVFTFKWAGVGGQICSSPDKEKLHSFGSGHERSQFL